MRLIRQGTREKLTWQIIVCKLIALEPCIDFGSAFRSLFRNE